MITKDGRDLPIEKLTAENYIVPKGEEKDYHAVIEVRQFDQKTGRRLSTPRIQKFGRKAFESHIQASLRKQGYEVTILHDPNDWIKENQAKLAAQAKAKADAQAKAIAEAKAAEKAAMKAEIIAELKAEGLLAETAEEASKKGAKKTPKE
jgi:membrane protein involved in colicin uptake